MLESYGECCRPWSKVGKNPGAGTHLARLFKDMAVLSLQRFTRYPGSQVSIKPLALPTTERYASPLKGYRGEMKPC